MNINALMLVAIISISLPACGRKPPTNETIIVQLEAITTDGKKVILNDDGHWKDADTTLKEIPLADGMRVIQNDDGTTQIYDGRTVGDIKITEGTTSEGKKVNIYNDGRWYYLSTKQKKSLNCEDLISSSTDKMTGKTSTSSNETLIISEDDGISGFGIYAATFTTDVSQAEYLLLSIQVAGAGSCIDDDDKMNVLFTDGTRLELENDGKFNCDGEFKLYFGGEFEFLKKEREIFRTKEIETIRIWTSKSYVERDFTFDQSEQFMKTVSCLVK